MTFSGKKYRRVRCENVEVLMKLANASDREIQLLKESTAVFSFVRIDEENFHYMLETGGRQTNHTFTLSKEQELQRRDGDIVLVTYLMENDSSIRQVIKQANGKILHFKREFGDNDALMTITVEGSDKKAVIYYEALEE